MFSNILMLFLAAFTIYTIPKIDSLTEKQLTANDLPKPALKDLAKNHNIELGNFAIYKHIYDKQYSDILTSQFGVALLDNTPNWYFTDGGLRPSKDKYNFAQMDEVVKYAHENNMTMQAHHYVWGEEKWLPAWLKDGNYNKEELYDILQNHILTVGSRYRGQIKEWTVVNEAFSRGLHFNNLNDWWQEAIGDKSYIDKAFIWARQADPTSVLILNDFGNEKKGPISSSMQDYIKGAKNRGVPIDAIGMQMHIDGSNPPSKEEIKQNINKFAELGVDIYVTEFDVNMDGAKGTNAQKDNKQADIYYNALRACLEVNSCKSFSVLGVTDKETWYSYLDYKNPRPLPFDDKYQPKPAFYAMRRALEQ